jgi:CheY-like chemotaxis protein
LSIPIIALTADVTTVDLAKCKAVGMNDYIAKPVNERLLYSKIIGAVKKSILAEPVDELKPNGSIQKKLKYTDLDYLMRRTKENPALMMEMISIYLEQTPALISNMKQSWVDKDWDALQSAVHKMIPSFSIMGINTDFEKMAIHVKEYASSQEQSADISHLILQLEDVCTHACTELTEAFNHIKEKANEK